MANFRLMLLMLLLCKVTMSTAQNAKETISFSKDVKDYGPIFIKKIESLIQKKGGTLSIAYGNYPLLTPIKIVNHDKKVSIKITGTKNSKGKRPVLQDQDRAGAPHNFFDFEGHSTRPGMIVSISNLEMIGNNTPFTSQHPFFGDPKKAYSYAIGGLNMASFHVSNVIIRNFYGTGIILANYYGANYTKLHRMESPTIKNCQIIDVWSKSAKDDAGDGLVLWSVNKPVVENNIIVNTISKSKYFGRGGLILEHNTEGAKVTNNTIGGYQRNIHIECDWGGHVIERNKLVQSSVAVTLSEDCNQDIKEKDQFSPIIIRNNQISYNQEFRLHNIPRSDFSFISVHKPSFMLDGLQVIDNKMTYSINQKVDQSKVSSRIKEKNTNIYIDLNGQPNAIVKGNKLQ